MSEITDLIYDAKRKMLAKYPRFGSEIAVANIEFRDDLPSHTAATDGKNIYVDPKYFASLSEDDRLFTIAHEIMHIKFMHMYRLKDKNGEKRDFKLWNIATDAIINANLERDGFRIKDGCINMPEALNYSAEEFYQKLLQEKEKNEQEQKNNQNQEHGKEQYNENAEQTENQNPNEGESQGDDHSLWEEAFKEQQSSQQKEQRQDKNSPTQKDKQEQTKEEQANIDFDERGEFEDNREEKREKFKSRREKTEKDIRSSKKGKIELGNIGKSKKEIDWKLLLRREVEKTEAIWSKRRSIAENNYAYRLEENDIEDEAETEVMIDISGSVNLELVKSFLRQLKPLLGQSKLKVGCFNMKFWGFIDIKSVKDINNFTVPRESREYYASGTDLDLPVRSFTKKREINKIIFTDGYPSYGCMPKEDLKKENIIWMVYGNRDFKPCCGKVINITEKQLEQLYQIDKSSTIDDIAR